MATHDVTKEDMQRIMRVIHALWPEIDHRSYLADEIESAAMYGLAQAALTFDAERSEQMDWKFYSQQLSIFRVIDMFRLEARRPVGIIGDGRQNGDAAFQVIRPPDEDGIHNLDPSKMEEHTHEIDIGQYMADKEFIRVLIEGLDTLRLEPAKHSKRMWLLFLSGHDQATIGRKLKLNPSNISYMIKTQKHQVMNWMIKHYYSKYPYPE